MDAKSSTQNHATIGEPMDWAPRLAAILDEQLRVCADLQELSRQQGDRIREGDTGSLMRVLGERQGLVNRLTGLNVEMEPYRREWEWCMSRLDEAQRGAMEHAVRELGQLIELISASDDADRRELEQQRSAVSQELAGLGRARVAVSAYGGRPGTQGPMFQDWSC
jgi:flagellar biosynthesis/type III secretory pathway chaperone